MSRFDRAHNYDILLPFHNNYGPICYRFLHRPIAIGRKSRNLYTPPVFNATVWGDLPELRKMFSTCQLQWLGYHMLRKYDD